MMWTVIERVDARAAGREAVFDMIVRSSKKVDGHEAAGDPPLIGDHDDGKAASIELAHCVDGKRKELQPIEVVQISGLLDEGAVTVHENCRSAHALESIARAEAIVLG